MNLVGRRAECDTLDRLVEAVDAWYSRAWVMCGQPTVGTTASIRYLIRRSAVEIVKTARYRSRSSRWNPLTRMELNHG
jgi:hypothetical protein